MEEYQDNQIIILKTETKEEMEEKCTKLINKGFELVGDIKIYYQNNILDSNINKNKSKNTNNYVYHQMLKYSRLLDLKLNYVWSDWE